MKASELVEMTADELGTKLGDLREEYFNLKFQHATGQLDNPMRLVETKKDIARILTVLNQKTPAGQA
jgi:large subunit ribosomal protein L29